MADACRNRHLHEYMLDVADVCRDRHFNDYIVFTYLILDWKKMPSKVTSK